MVEPAGGDIYAGLFSLFPQLLSRRSFLDGEREGVAEADRADAALQPFGNQVTAPSADKPGAAVGRRRVDSVSGTVVTGCHNWRTSGE